MQLWQQQKMCFSGILLLYKLIFRAFSVIFSLIHGTDRSPPPEQPDTKFYLLPKPPPISKVNAINTSWDELHVSGHFQDDRNSDLKIKCINA